MYVLLLARDLDLLGGDDGQALLQDPQLQQGDKDKE
jgi:hypothetical protein